jgi:Coenzyme PQQ synthesis protein D (PqqD)
MDRLNYYPIPKPGVIGKIVDNEAVVILTNQGQVKVLNEVGARIWELADGYRKISDIVKIMSDEFDGKFDMIEEDTLDFIDQLVSKGMLRISYEPLTKEAPAV